MFYYLIIIIIEYKSFEDYKFQNILHISVFNKVCQYFNLKHLLK